MHSTDSLNYADMTGKTEQSSPPAAQNLDVSLEGSDNQGSPVVSSASPPVSPSSLHEINISQQNVIPVTMSHYCPSTPTPMSGHQILIDPKTGQHFLVSSAPPQPQIIYQPVYYSATPAQPIYYHAYPSGVHGAYMLATPPPSNTNATSQMITTAMPRMALNHNFTSISPPIVPKTGIGFVQNIAEVDDERFAATNDDWHNDSERNGSAKRHFLSYKISDSSSQQPAHFTNSGPSVESHNSSSPVSDGYCAHGQTDIHHYHSDEYRVQQHDGEHTPLFGTAPIWWGEGTPAMSRENARNQPTSDREGRKKMQTAAVVPSRRPPKPIRMDIDLNQSFADEKMLQMDKMKVPSRSSLSTAFTVSFGAEEGSPKSSISLQDAARKSIGSSRRLMRKSAPANAEFSIGTAAKIAGVSAESVDPKQYLLNKMLMGVGEEVEGAPELLPSCYEENIARPDVDSLSEAGTYIVEEGDRLNQMITSQRMRDSDLDSMSSESSNTQCADNFRSSNCIRLSQALPQINENSGAGRSSPDKSTHLIRELMRLSSARINECDREMTNIDRQVAPSSPLGIASRFSLTSAKTLHGTNREQRSITSSHRLCALASISSRTSTSAQSHRSQPVYDTSSSSVPQASCFRRGDGGRFSMRSSDCNSSKAANTGCSSSSTKSGKNTARIAGAGNVRGQINNAMSQKESAEMTAWLRRKDYNPMRAVAEAKKLQQLKARTDQFMSNRSISFHQGNRLSTNHGPSDCDLSKSRNNKSQDDLSIQNTCCGPETILASYSKGISKDLNKLKSMDVSQEHTDDAKLFSFENAVKQLSMKCNRSIELIRKSHQGGLSNSVESLLEAVEPTEGQKGSVTSQLDRLSAAFDAIQKYLEISSVASLPASPIRSSPPSAMLSNPLSTSPSRRLCSAYQNQLATAKRNPSGITRNQ